MLNYFELRKGVEFILDGEPCKVLEFQQVYKAQDAVVSKVKVRNLITGKVLEKTFHQGNMFEEAELEKMEVKFLYSHRGKLGLCEAKNPAKRFELNQDQIGEGSKFLKPNDILTALLFQGKIINVLLPIKVYLKVTEADPGFKGDSAQGGTKTVTLETGAEINVPLFVEQDDVIEINTETGEYVRRTEQ